MSDKYHDLLSHAQHQYKKLKALGKRVDQIEQARVSEQLQKLKNDIAELE